MLIKQKIARFYEILLLSMISKVYRKILVSLGLFQNIEIFELGNAESWKSQYCSYLLIVLNGEHPKKVL
jgi:hypothetical protein